MKKIALLLSTALAAVLPASGGETSKANATSCGECCGADACAGLVSTYEKVSVALAADDLAAAQDAAVNLACCLNCRDQADLAAKVETFGEAKSLADARTQFKAISAAIIPLAEKSGEHFVMTCPMAGADWIQTTSELANPYYGSQMLRCGSVKKEGHARSLNSLSQHCWQYATPPVSGGVARF